MERRVGALTTHPHPGLRFAIADASIGVFDNNGGLKAAYATLPTRGRDFVSIAV